MLKRLVCILLCTVLIAAAAPGAWAKGCELGTTEKFMEALDEEGLFYSYEGEYNVYEVVEISFETKVIDDLEMIWFFDSNERSVTVAWQPFEYDTSLRDELLEELNQLNAEYSFIKWFTVDDSDKIMTQMDLIIRDNENLGEICLDAMKFYLETMDESYERLLYYAA